MGQRVEENSFIRTLATAIYKHSIFRLKLNPERLSKLSKLFSKYVDNNSTYELQCLYALQSLVNQLEHPQGEYAISFPVTQFQLQVTSFLISDLAFYTVEIVMVCSCFIFIFSYGT